MLCRHRQINRQLRNGTYATPVTPAFRRCQVPFIDAALRRRTPCVQASHSMLNFSSSPILAVRHPIVLVAFIRIYPCCGVTDNLACNPLQDQLTWWNQYGPGGEPAQYRTVPVPFQPSNATSPAA